MRSETNMTPKLVANAPPSDGTVTIVTSPSILAEIETYYDAVPRPMATAEEVGPFTLFLARCGQRRGSSTPDRGWASEHEFTADDVRRLFERQDELGTPRNLEWVHETTPSLLAAVQRGHRRPDGRGARGVPACWCCRRTSTCRPRPRSASSTPTTRTWPPRTNVIHAAFEGSDEIVEQPLGMRPELVRAGVLVRRRRTSTARSPVAEAPRPAATGRS